MTDDVARSPLGQALRAQTDYLKRLESKAVDGKNVVRFVDWERPELGTIEFDPDSESPKTARTAQSGLTMSGYRFLNSEVRRIIEHGRANPEKRRKWIRRRRL